MDTQTIRRTLPTGAHTRHWTAGDGWPLRALDWPVDDKPRGSLLFLSGRADFFEKYLESFAHWNSRQWSVTSFDWRGQGGSGRLAADPLAGHIDRFETWMLDLSAFFADWRRTTPAPHVIVAHSMGGNIVLRTLIDNLVNPDAVVLLSPMLGIKLVPLPGWLVSGIARTVAHVWRKGATRNTANKSKGGLRDRQLLLTHSDDRFGDEEWWKTERPDLALGPPTFGWLAEAYRSIDCLNADGALEAVQTPILVLGTFGDRLVSANAIVAAAARLKNSTFHMFGTKVAHEILRETDDARIEALAMIDRFLDGAAPTP